MSAVMKAIKITKENKARLEIQYNLDTGYLEFSSGLYLVSLFGENAMYEGLFTTLGYKTRFEETGKKLKNDYVEVTPK
jgi:hypothetical protein